MGEEGIIGAYLALTVANGLSLLRLVVVVVVVVDVVVVASDQFISTEIADNSQSTF